MEVCFRDNGIQQYALSDQTKITGVSANSWGEFCLLLEETGDNSPIVVSPELITYANEPFVDLVNNRVLIEERIERVLEFSKFREGTLFILGTPLFVENEKPRNSALLIQNGGIVGVTNKRSGATKMENESFDLVPEEPPLLIPGTKTALLICADLPTACLCLHPDDRFFERTLELSNRRQLIGKKVSLLPDEATSLLVIACWGVGGSCVKRDKANEYYEYQLRNIVWNLMRETRIKEVVVVDRVPKGVPAETKDLTPDIPYNGLFRKTC